MAVMKMDVNFAFFILIIVTVVSFAGFTAYYQASFHNISKEYNEKLAELNKVTKDLLEKKAILMQTSEQLNLTTKKVSEKEKLYSELKKERDNLQRERDLLSETLQETRAELTEANLNVESLRNQLEIAERRIADLNYDKEYYKNKYEECEEQLEEQG